MKGERRAQEEGGICKKGVMVVDWYAVPLRCIVYRDGGRTGRWRKDGGGRKETWKERRRDQARYEDGGRIWMELGGGLE